MYLVEWLRPALDEVLQRWLDSDSSTRSKITGAVTQIDLLLQSNPVEEGESRDENERILIELPLAVNYSINERARIVTVSEARFLAPRGS